MTPDTKKPNEDCKFCNDSTIKKIFKLGVPSSSEQSELIHQILKILYDQEQTQFPRWKKENCFDMAFSPYNHRVVKLTLEENKRQRLADLDEFYNLFTISVTWGEIKNWIAQKRKQIEDDGK